MKFTLVVVLIISLVPLCYGNMALEEAQRCIHNDWSSGIPNGENVSEKVCNEIRSGVACSDKETSDSSALLEDWRFLIEQEAIFQQKYHLCEPEVDYSNLTTLLVESRTKENYGQYILDHDIAEPCALDVYKKCSQEYYEAFPKLKGMCSLLSVFISCLKEEHKNTCDAQILEHFTSIYDRFGHDTMKKLEKDIPEEC